MKRYLLVAALALPSVLFAQDSQDFCKYTTETAQAQATQLQAPNAEAGLTPNQGIKSQEFVGLNSDIANWRKAALTRKVAQATCGQYTSTEFGQLKIQYAVQVIEKQALINRLRALDEAQEKIFHIQTTTNKTLQAQDATIQSMYAIDSAQQAVSTDRVKTSVSERSIVVPEISDAPLSVLISESKQADMSVQDAQAKLIKANNWDLSVRAGARHELTPFANANAGGYVGLNLQYNLGRKRVDAHLNAAGDALSALEVSRYTGLERQSYLLAQGLAATLGAQQDALRGLQARRSKLESYLAAVPDPNTAAALVFHNQVLVDQALLDVELSDTQFRIATLKQFIQENF